MKMSAIAAGIFLGCVGAAGAQSAWNISGSGALAVTNAGTQLITAMTANSNSRALPTKVNQLWVQNVGSSVGAAICPNTSTAGAACSCAENGVSASNGIPVPANYGAQGMPLVNVAVANVTVVACGAGGTTLVFWGW